MRVNMSPFQLSTFSALKSYSKKNLLLGESLSALTHRADASTGAKDEDYSGAANFEHTHTHGLQERCPFHYRAITLQRRSPPFRSPAHDNSNVCLSTPVTAFALGGLCQLHHIHHLSDSDKLV